MDFIVCERLAAGLVLECNFCDKFVESIRPRKRCVEMDDGSTLPLVREPSRRVAEAIALPAKQEYPALNGRDSTSVRMARLTVLRPQRQIYVSVTRGRLGPCVILPPDEFYQKHQLLTMNGTVELQPGNPFRILVVSYSENPFALAKNQVI